MWKTIFLNDNLCPMSLVKTWTLHNGKIYDSFREKKILCWKRSVLPRVTLSLDKDTPFVDPLILTFQRAVVVGVEPRADIKWVATGVRSEEFRCDNHACGLRPPAFIDYCLILWYTFLTTMVAMCVCLRSLSMVLFYVSTFLTTMAEICV